MKNVLWASAVIGIALLSCGGGDGAGVVGGVSEYLGTASVGDFLKVSVDHATHTITYQNLTNGQQGTVPYSLASDGGFDIQDPQGNLVRGYEIPNFAVVLEVHNAGPNQDTSCLAFAVQQAPLDVAGLVSKKFNFMQFRTKSGGMEVGNAQMSNGVLNTENFWPYGAMNGGQSFNSGSMSTDDWQLHASGTYWIVPGDGNAPDYIFGTPSGVLAIDTPNGNIIALEQQSSKNLLPERAGTYKAICYLKDDAIMTQGGQEVGTLEVGKATIVVTVNSHISVWNESGDLLVDTDLVPVADQAYLVGAGKLTDPCHGLFTFRVTDNGEDTDVFVTFIEGAILFSSFAPGTGSQYDYLYGVGLQS